MIWKLKDNVFDSGWFFVWAQKLTFEYGLLLCYNITCDRSNENLSNVIHLRFLTKSNMNENYSYMFQCWRYRQLLYGSFFWLTILFFISSMTRLFAQSLTDTVGIEFFSYWMAMTDDDNDRWWHWKLICLMLLLLIF